MFRRRQVKTHGRLMREEFSEGFHHLRMAAAHAAGGATGLVRPRVEAASETVKPKLRKAGRGVAATAIPLAMMTRGGARAARRQAEEAATATRRGARRGRAKAMAKMPAAMMAMPMMRKQRRMRRWPMMLGGLVAVGAAVGAAGAMVARRRASHGQWEEYGSPTGTGRAESMIESTKATVQSGREKVQSLAESAKERAAGMMGGSSGTGGSTGTGVSGPTTGPTAAGSTGVSGATGTVGATGSAGSMGTPPAGGTTAEFGTREDLYGRAGTSPNNNRP